MTRFRTVPLSLVGLLAMLSPAAMAADPSFGQSVSRLTATQAANFQFGKLEFNSAEEVDEGLGPVFNGRSCAECHSVPAVGGGSARVETRFGKLTNGVFDGLSQFGGSLIQDFAIGPADGSSHQFLADVVPPSATIVAGRRTTPLFGLGLVDATDDSTFITLAFLEQLRFDGTAGRVARVTNVTNGQTEIGKFGWKNQVPTLLMFSADAYLNEMGITSPFFQTENCPRGNCAELAFNPLPGINDDGHGVTAFNDFMTMLAPPPQAEPTLQSLQGSVVFVAIGCDACHTPTLVTGSSPIAELDHKAYQPFSDFLLHDMGSLGDGIVQGAASGREMRTAPLWGLRMITTFLHDGRATTIDAAILAHAGQAQAARNRFAALSPGNKAALRAFLNTL